MDARDTLRRLLRRMGYEVRQFTPVRSLAAARSDLFRRRAIELVLDVGANAGQYGALLRREGYTDRLVSLEPLAEPFQALRGLAAADGAWTALRMAASNADGEVVLQVTEDSRSSSVLSRDERFGATPGWAPRGEERAPARRLSGLAGELVHPGERPYLRRERDFRPMHLEPILLDDDGLLVELDGVFARA